jgi:hypothetical protein
VIETFLFIRNKVGMKRTVGIDSAKRNVRKRYNFTYFANLRNSSTFGGYITLSFKKHFLPHSNDKLVWQHRQKAQLDRPRQINWFTGVKWTALTRQQAVSG